MRIKIDNRNLTVKEFLMILQRVLEEEQITKIHNPSVYIGTSKKVLEVSLRKTEYDLEGHEQDGFDSIAF